VWSDNVWVVDSTPVECAQSREALRGSDLAGWTEYGYCASYSRNFWGRRLQLVATLHGLEGTIYQCPEGETSYLAEQMVP
jgi:hypothetical protein